MQSRCFAFTATTVVAMFFGVSFVAVSSGDAGPSHSTRGEACTPTWRTVTGPKVRDGTLKSVAALSETDAWAVGGIVRRRHGDEIVSASPLTEHWNGERWAVVASPPYSGALNDLAIVSQRDVWAVGGDWGFLLRWNGDRWSRMHMSSIPSAAISALGADDVWVVGGDEVAHWNGTDWRRATPRRDADLLDVVAISKRDVWAVGTTGKRALALHWNGTRWQSHVLKGADHLDTVAGLRPNDVWAGGAADDDDLLPGAMEPVAFRWNRGRWVRVDVPYEGDTGFSEIAVSRAGEVWATSGNPYDYGLVEGAGSWVWRRAGGRWAASALTDGWVLAGIAAAPTGAASAPVVWAVGQIGTAPSGWEGYFPAHTTPLIRRYGC
jgi:hypothetical protein